MRPREKFAAGLRTLLGRRSPLHGDQLEPFIRRSDRADRRLNIASSQVIVTLPAYHQIEAGEVTKLVAASIPPTSSSAGAGRASAARSSAMRRATSMACSAAVTRLKFHDLGCGARGWTGACSRKSSSTATNTASWLCWPTRGSRPRGGRPAVPQGSLHGVYEPREYTSAACWTSSPCSSSCALHQEAAALLRHGGCHDVCGRRAGRHLAGDRATVLRQALAERPALLLASLLVVLGLQMFALGLLGELLIFTHARTIKDYQIDASIQFCRNQSPAPTASGASQDDDEGLRQVGKFPLAPPRLGGD